MKRQAFTLVELLVTIAIIGILSAMLFGAMSSARTAAREAATKATIVKLNAIIMQRYESYMTRRVPIRIPSGVNPRDAAQRRLDAIRDLMRMEMPDARSDITNGPFAFTWGTVPEPALHRLYAANPPTANLDAAQCLYNLVSMGSPEAMEQFNQNEIGTVDGKPVFIDGWGMPIMWLRWAPGWVSGVQTGDATKDHDPFDTQNVQPGAFNLVPLIYSATGKRKPDGSPQYGIDLQAGYVFAGDPYGNPNLGKPISGEGAEGIITNHPIEQR